MKKSEEGRPGGALLGLPQAVLLAALLLLAWLLSHVLLIIFAGLLIAVFLRHLALKLNKLTQLSVRVALALSIAGVATIIVALLAWAGTRVAGELEQLIASLPGAIANLEQDIRSTQAGRYVLEHLNGASDGERPPWQVFGSVGGALSSLGSIVLQAVITLMIAIFFAVEPGLYRRGVLRLTPLQKRPRAVEVMDAVGEGLWNWMLAQFAAMLIVGTMATVGLSLLGVPLPLVLGILAGLTNFIPQIGPYIAGVPAVLIALTISPELALYTALLIVLIHQIEGNLLLPLLQKKATDLPPVLTLAAVIAGGILFGALGLLLATPLLVAAMIIIRMLYVEDVLGDRFSEEGEVSEQDLVGESSDEQESVAPTKYE